MKTYEQHMKNMVNETKENETKLVFHNKLKMQSSINSQTIHNKKYVPTNCHAFAMNVPMHLNHSSKNEF